MTVLLTLEVMEVSSQKMVRAMTVRVGGHIPASEVKLVYMLIIFQSCTCNVSQLWIICQL
jgi:hypothetical protein